MKPIEVEALLAPYFKKKIGQKVCRRVRTANDLAFQVWARDYQAEVLAVDGNTAYVQLTSIDLAPSESHRAGSDRVLGDYQIDLTGMAGLDPFWRKLLGFADPQWAKLITPSGNI
jgi:hypothetical protein